MTVKGIKIKPSKETKERARQEITNFNQEYPNGVYIHLRDKRDFSDNG